MPVTSNNGYATDYNNYSPSNIALARTPFNVPSFTDPLEYLIDSTTNANGGEIYIKSGGPAQAYGKVGAVNFTISEDMRNFGGEIHLSGWGDLSLGNGYVNDPMLLYIPRNWSADFVAPFNAGNSFKTDQGYNGQPYIDTRLSIKDENGVEQFTLRLTNWEVGTDLGFIREICFADGAMVLLGDGRRVAVEDLKVGDMVATKDHGAQPLRAVLRSKVSSETLAQFPERRPVRVKAGSFGEHEDCVVSAQHRVLVASDLADVLYDAPEVLVPAIHLVASGKAEIVEDCVQLTYHHLVFDQHEIVNADGLWSESFQPGAYSLSHAQRDVRKELGALFVDLKETGEYPFISARPSLSRREVSIIGL